MLNKIICGDCLEVMPKIPDKSIDMILCDLPYGKIACKWDVKISFIPLWEQYERIIKDRGVIVLTAVQPFTSELVMSNVKMFKYTWVWEKSRPTNFMLSINQPLRYHEDICVFYRNQCKYRPIMTHGLPNHATKAKFGFTRIYDRENKAKANTNTDKYPSSVIKIKSTNSTQNIHPTQKPVALFEYLIKTYTNEGELVLDNCIGSGTTAVACVNTGRNFIGIELNKECVKIAEKRIKAVPERLPL